MFNGKSMTKEDRRYQKFILGLKRDIDFYLDQCLRENRFDNRTTIASPRRPVVQPTRPSSKLSTCRSSETGTFISSVRHREDPFEMMKKTERKRITADVDTILKGPSLKTFYQQFFQNPSSKRRRAPRPSIDSTHWEESLILWDVISENRL